MQPYVFYFTENKFISLYVVIIFPQVYTTIVSSHIFRIIQEGKQLKKKNNSKEKLIRYLTDHPNTDILREDIMAATSISKSRLSELLNQLIREGNNIISPSRSGIIKFIPDKDISTDISSKDIRQWLILLSLSKLKKATYQEIIMCILSLYDCMYLYEKMYTGENYTDSDISKYLIEHSPDLKNDLDELMSLQTLRKDLGELVKEGYIEKKRILYKNSMHIIYELSDSCPCILFESEDTLNDFLSFFDNFNNHFTANISLKHVYDKARFIYDWESFDSTSRTYGRSNIVDPLQLKFLNSFLTQPYKKKVLHIDYSGSNGQIHLEIKTGLLFYSTETCCFYNLCYNTTANMVAQLRLDRITKIESTEIANDYYRCAKIEEIYSEMFSSSYDADCTHVKVLFQDFGNISERLNSLHNNRVNSRLYKIDQPINGIPHSYVYEDNIRGISSFARYLRSFGNSALVLEPPFLQEQMIASVNKVLENYEVN